MREEACLPDSYRTGRHLFVLTFFGYFFVPAYRVAASAKAGQDKKVPNQKLKPTINI
jgi:hypothetical protein